MKIIFALFLTLCLAASAYADKVYLKNGRSIEGIIKSDNAEAVEVEVGVASSVTFLKSDVGKIVKSSETDSSTLRQAWKSRKHEFDQKLAKLEKEKEKEPKTAGFSKSAKGITVDVLLNDKVNASMLLDTGASTVMLSRNIAEKLGINLSNVKPDLTVQVADGREVNAKRVVIQSMKVQEATALKVDAAVLLEDTGGMVFGDGLLGMSFLSKFNFKIDSDAKKLILQKL
jgi:clan AA aspartic protease (TIGR02281 family)